jgi:hypothetical protein
MADFRLSRVLPNGTSGGGVAHRAQEVHVAEGVPGLRLGGVAEEAAHLRVALDVRHAREVEVPAVGLALARERVLEVVVLLVPFRSFIVPPWVDRVENGY